MNLLWKVLILSFVFLSQVFVHDALAQGKSKSMRDIERRSNRNELSLEPTESKKVREAKKKVQDQKEKQIEKAEVDRQQGIKEHMDRQTVQTKERMKETFKKSEELRNRDKVPFWKRIFKRKKKHYES